MISTKEQLIKKIQETENEDFLSSLLSVFDKNEEIIQFTEEQKSSVLKAQRQISDGESFTLNEINDQFTEWQQK